MSVSNIFITAVLFLWYNKISWGKVKCPGIIHKSVKPKDLITPNVTSQNSHISLFLYDWKTMMYTIKLSFAISYTLKPDMFGKGGFICMFNVTSKNNFIMCTPYLLSSDTIFFHTKISNMNAKWSAHVNPNCWISIEL